MPTTPSPTPLPNCEPCTAEDISSVVLVFAGKRCAGQPSDSFPNFYTKESSKFDDGSITLAFRDTACALYDVGTSTPTNQAALDDLTQQFAHDFFQWLCFTGDQSFDGIAAITPTGLYDYIYFDYYVDETCKTRVATPPLLDYSRELGHFDPAESDCTLTATPCMFVYGPPADNCSLTRYKLCLQDGRLLTTYVSTDHL